MNRRNFLRGVPSMTALLSVFPATLSAIEREKVPGQLERRSLGRTGEKLSILGFGGIVVMNATSQDASKRVGEAIDAGINYFDVAPSYGNAEERLGPALEAYRKDVFLACKTTQRSKAGAAAELESSLKKMRTDHFNLYQLHAVAKLEEVEQILKPGGALEAFLEAKKAGKIQFIGFSAHSVEAALALMDRFEFDTILFPINFATWYTGNFGPQVLAKAQEKKMGILALKAMANRPWPEGSTKTFSKCWYEPLSDPSEAMLGLRFTLSHPITAAIPPGDENLFRMALQLAARFAPLSPSEAEVIKQKAMKSVPIFKYPQQEVSA
jgi:predicted aldo/keto reductase-like oxidoreductase